MNSVYLLSIIHYLQKDAKELIHFVELMINRMETVLHVIRDMHSYKAIVNYLEFYKTVNIYKIMNVLNVFKNII